MTKVTEKTLIPLGLAVAVIGGGAIWLTSLHFANVAVAKDIVVIQKRQDALEGIQTDIAVIKTKLDELIENKNGERKNGR